jgi:hypothetical protein
LAIDPDAGDKKKITSTRNPFFGWAERRARDGSSPATFFRALPTNHRRIFSQPITLHRGTNFRFGELLDIAA